MKYSLLILLSLLATEVMATPLDECIDARLKQLQENEVFSRSGKVRCEGAGFFEGGKFEKSDICFNASPGWTINGNAKVRIVSDNHGRAGAVNYARNEKGVVTKACVQISCSSPSKPFGPGAWMAIELTGTVKKIITEQDRESSVKFCVDLLSQN